MKKLIFIIPIVIILLVAVTAKYSADTPKVSKPETQNQRFKTHVKVSCDDDTTKSMIESHIKRELRSLGDVDLVDKENAKYILFLVAIAHTSKSTGNKTGSTSIASMRLSKEDSINAISMAIWEYRMTFEPNYFKLPAEERVKRQKKRFELAEEYGFSDSYHYPDLGLIINIPDNDLPDTCKEIVAEFDVERLEPIREIYQSIKHQLKR